MKKIASIEQDVTTVCRINQLREQLNTEMGNLKTELAGHLERAADTFEILKSFGITPAILNDETFVKFRTSFASVQVPTPAAELPVKMEGKTGGKGQESILKAIGKGSISEKRIKELTGKSGINTTLNKMVANGFLKKDESVRPSLYSKA